MIFFHEVSWRNFLSTGNAYTRVRLDQGTDTLIIGKNGAGKSTILDAICFALFGTAYRNINKPLLVNSINQNNCQVNIEFSIGKKVYKVERGIKPAIFNIICDGVLVNQDAKSRDYQEYLENHIIKMNKKAFTQVVIMGSASFVPFMQLKPADRREIIEDLLDIQIFSSMNMVAKERLAQIKDERSKNKFDIELIEEKIELQKQNIKEHIEHSEEEIQNKQAEIKLAQETIEGYRANVKLILSHVDAMQRKIEDKTTVESKVRKLVQIEAKIETNIKKVEKDIEFYSNNHNCPTCKQVIDTVFRQEQIVERGTRKKELQEGVLKLDAEMDKLNARTWEITGILGKIASHSAEVGKINHAIWTLNNNISKLNAEILKLTNRKDTLEDDNLKLKEFKEKLEVLVKKEEKLSIEKYYYDHAANLLKDTGIKTNIIRKYLPIMNKLINKYLTDLDFFVNFNIDENFKEVIKSRHRDEFVYESFSEGEKQKIDLALLFAWRQIAKLKNSADTNLLMMDEIFDSSLDNMSVELLMGLLKNFKDETVFIISHKGDQIVDKYKNIIKFDNKNNFSYIA